MSSFYISAYLNGNLGDDLFIYTLINRYKSSKIYVCGAPETTKYFKAFSNVVTVPRWKWFLLKLKRRLKGLTGAIQDESYIRKTDFVIKIGGSIFMEYPKWAQNWVEYNKPFFIIGANYGPADSEEFHDMVMKKISGAVSCCFRDTYSYHQFENLNNVRYAPDILFGLDVYGLIKRHPGKGVAISLIELESRKQYTEYAEEYYNVIAKISDHLSENRIPVTLLAFCEKEGDTRAVHQVLSRCRYASKVTCASYDGDYIKILDLIESCDTIIATRFHAMILGWIMGKKVIPIIYSSKQTHVIKDVQFHGTTIDIKNIADSKDIIIDAFDQENGKLSNVRQLANMSFAQFEALDEYIQSLDVKKRNL